jgi:quercetin dioxygenase-like cupin family protein
MPLRELASKTDLSIGALSQIERGDMTPSLSSMIRIAQSLERPMGHFFDHPGPLRQEAVFIEKGKEALLHSSLNRSVYRLYYDETSNVEIVKVIFEVSGTTGDEKYQHEGEEWGMVLEGRLKVELGNKTYILNEGDSIFFKSDVPHRLLNAYKGRTVEVWYNSPPLYVVGARKNLRSLQRKIRKDLH